MTQALNGKIPLIDYPWHSDIDRLAQWSLTQPPHARAFCFDLAMSLAYIDATPGIERYIETCSSLSNGYYAHLGFINLCAPCYENGQKYHFQKAAKPQSGAIGKLSSEIVLRFIRNVYPQFHTVLSVGGVESADAMIEHQNGTIILAEVKSAPLLTYPIVFKTKNIAEGHKKINITSSQLKECESALYLHNKKTIPLGKVKSELWPFRPAIDYITSKMNKKSVDEILSTWSDARDVYQKKDRNAGLYYLANASGQPPLIARTRDQWPARESVSDSKTSAGMDRTDDIKKGIYQVLKIGIEYSDNPDIKTAIISNLPAYRHGKEYVSPFITMLWGNEKDICEINGDQAIKRQHLKWAFDYIITLEEPLLRDIQ
jgi:hypothetical protein